MGGDYTIDNAGPLASGDYLGACGSIHEQLRNVPDGAPVTLKVVNPPNVHVVANGQGKEPH
jgi:hypothetical protein